MTLVDASSGAHSATFSFKNNCPFTVWPASLANSDKGALSQTGFQLDNGASFSLDAPPAWGGRLWARQTCSTDSAGKFSCITGDCGTGQVACNGAGGAPPTTLIEFTLQGDGGKDFYDVSCVDGFSLPVLVVPSGGSNCNSTSCPVNVNALCPQELRITAPDGGVVGCKSACLAFNTDEYCCRGQYGSPTLASLPPTPRSSRMHVLKHIVMLMMIGPAPSLVWGANYDITFCP
ncbi:unnamed protein product [Musa acuminata subsp. malaccensis]|uniref:(wild Malaysian banana) hypothetical protein n=1 Tax=Musa acuminata subsp. malaccensis TaxID=214687 RepID=A0A8D6ZLG4_MUSAM|nr:unnamed protein product [Musa acuminata subsp. malaccensis]